MKNLGGGLFRQSPKKIIGISITIIFVITLALMDINGRNEVLQNNLEKETLFSIYIDGEKVSQLPSKEDRYVFDEEKSFCNNNVNLNWSYPLWTANIDFGNYELENKERTYCNLYFKKEEYNYEYTGSEQEFIVPKAGYYQIELWGAAGGYETTKERQFGKGGYVRGTIFLDKNQSLHVYVGEQGNLSRVATFNGGGSGGLANISGSSGGGATDIRLENGNWNDFKSLKTRIMVAGAGGGSGFGYYTTAGENCYAGGLKGYSGGYYKGHLYQYQNGMPGTQTSGGAAGKNIYNATGTAFAGIFGIGGNNETISNSHGAGGGGGGYYGGGAGGGTQDGGAGQGGGGGSSFISGHNGCNAIKEESTANNIVHTGKPDHYSGYVFENTKMIDGMGYVWTEKKQNQEAMPSPTGGYYELGIGHTGNGYAKMTYLGR